MEARASMTSLISSHAHPRHVHPRPRPFTRRVDGEPIAEKGRGNLVIDSLWQADQPARLQEHVFVDATGLFRIW